MIKSLHAYNKLAKKATKEVIKIRKVSIFKHLFLMIATALSYLLFIPAPIFIHANIRMDKQNLEKGTYELTKCFDDSNDFKKYWKTLLCLLVKGIIVFSGLVLIGIVTFILYSIGSYLSQMMGSSIVLILFLIPCVIALVVYLVLTDILFKPTFYYLNEYDDISISDALNASVRSMNEQGKLHLFLMSLLFYLGIFAYLFVSIFIYLILYRSGNDIYIILSLFLSVLFVFLFIIFYPRFGIKFRINKLILMKDVMIDPAIKDESGKIKEKMIKQGLSKDEFLVNLFEKKKADDIENTSGNSELIDQTNEEIKEEVKEEAKAE